MLQCWCSSSDLKSAEAPSSSPSIQWLLAADGPTFPGEQPCSGNVAISGLGCSQEMRRQPWRYFLNLTGFFSCFVARNALGRPVLQRGVCWNPGPREAASEFGVVLAPGSDWGLGFESSEMWANDPKAWSQNSKHDLIKCFFFLLLMFSFACLFDFSLLGGFFRFVFGHTIK